MREQIGAVQLATYRGFPKSLPHTVPNHPFRTSVKWPDGLCVWELDGPRETSLGEWRGGTQDALGRALQASSGSGLPSSDLPSSDLPVTSFLRRYLEGWRRATCACLAFGRVPKPGAPTQQEGALERGLGLKESSTCLGHCLGSRWGNAKLHGGLRWPQR